MRKYDVNKQAALSLQECIKKAKDYGTDDPESINWICSSIVDKPNSSKNNNKSKGGMSDTWSNVNQKDQNSYTSAPDANPNAKTLDLSSIDKSQYTTTAGCVQDVMDNHGADRKTAVDFCTTPGMNLNNKGNGNGNSNTKSASIPSSIYALGLAQKPVTYMPPLTTTKTKVAFRNAAVNNRPSWVSTMKAMQYKTGLDPQNIAYYFNKDEGNNNKLRNASTATAATNNSIAVPAVFKCGNMRFKDVIS